MQLYGIRRRSWWKNAEELEAGGARSKEVGDEDGSGVRWIRSYVVQEVTGRSAPTASTRQRARRRSARTPRSPASAPTRSTSSSTP